ncbi:LysR family transcriptional regulator [Pseudoalteromonas ostreae]|uniref:LysR family transcriptional regulator n=1 Tax=Pseudoalteromonas ostreae TaxID=2774154 RepID=UPI001B38EF4D|nr:LysR family transcriptional regulator [Pseudoalteromonas ostreae]
MDLDALRTFYAFVETGSFTRAAQQVCRTQSAVSMQMKKLEQELGNPLFLKQGRQLVLSSSGVHLASYAKQLLALHDEAYKQLKTGGGKTRVRLACPDDYADEVLPKVVALLHKYIPQLNLQISCAPTNQLKAQLDQGLLDMVIATRSPSSEEGYFLQSSKGVWVKSAEFNYQSAMTLPVAIFQRDCKFHQAAVEGLLKTERPFNIIACCGSVSALTALINAKLALGVMAEVSKSSALEVINDLTLPSLPVIDIVLLHSVHNHNPVKQELVKLIAENY